MMTDRELRVPISLLQAVDRLHRTRMRLVKELNRDPDSDEIARATWIESPIVDLLLRVLQHFRSSEPGTLSPEEQPLAEIFGDDDRETPEQELRRQLAQLAEKYGEEEARRRSGEAVRKALATLSSREEQILRMRFGIGRRSLSLEEVAAEFGVSVTTIRGFEGKALRKLQQTSRSGNLAVPNCPCAIHRIHNVLQGDYLCEIFKPRPSTNPSQGSVSGKRHPVF